MLQAKEFIILQTVGLMRLGKLIFGLVLSLSLAGPSWAAKMYVIDELVVTVRQGRTITSPVVGRAKSLDSVEVINVEGEWTHIRLENGAEGWMQSKYLVRQQPAGLRLGEWDSQSEVLAAEIEKYGAENARLTGENEELRAELEETFATLAQMGEEHDRISRESGEYQALQVEYETLRDELEQVRAEAERLGLSSDATLNKRRLKWFLAGGGVLLAGWVIGVISIKRRRHYDSRLY
ncbi:MAG: TIGR04211 family SH3 domain-containing protein [Deltaproteobacteria bacterium]|nr:TIGR04211 family SH3 domain-containing protein [Deltaproteobacteria bacterium]